MSLKYANENKEFAEILASPDSADFRPRARMSYSEREAEQDAYFWFLQGQNYILRQQKKVSEEPV